MDSNTNTNQNNGSLPRPYRQLDPQPTVSDDPPVPIQVDDQPRFTDVTDDILADEPGDAVQHSSLNPLADDFFPFSVLLPPYDSTDELHDDEDCERLAQRADEIGVDHGLWLKLHESDDFARPPEPCECHQMPRGACPDVKAYHVNRISRGLQHAGINPNMDTLREPLRYPSFPVEVWKSMLHGYFDADEIIQGFCFGWDVSFTSPPEPKDAKWNLQGASLFQQDVQKYVDQESKFGTLVGPFKDSELPFRVFCSPINTVDKKNSKVRRTVIDCTQLNRGINAWIDAHMHRGKKWKLSLPTSATIIRLIQQTRAKYPGQKVLLFKIDFARWYRWFLLDPVQSIFFAIRWKGSVFLDMALSFGNRAAALAAQRVIWAVIFLYRTRVPPFPGTFNTGVSCSCTTHCDCGENRAAGYIDDFMGASPESLAQINFDSALALAKSLGLRISQTPGHVSPPNTVCECLGILYDTERNTMRLPPDKVVALTALLKVWVSKQTASEHELAVLCGKLLYAAGVIFAGRLFLNRCLATKRRASRHSTPITLDEDFWADIRWWQSAIALRNGITFLVPDSTVHVTLDASTNGFYGGLPGLGAYNHSTHQYFSTAPIPEYRDLCIADLELITHVVAVNLWGSEWKGMEVTIHTDNQACWHLLRNGRSRDDRRLRMSRRVATNQITNQWRLVSEWIPTSENSLADALSRVADRNQRESFQDHCDRLGGIPMQRHVSSEMYNFN